MGLDIFLNRYKGRKENGCLDYESAEKEYAWDSNRYSIRKDFLNNVEFVRISAENLYLDDTVLLRPENFKKAYEWANSLERKTERYYIKNILNILKSDENLYLELNY